jgi:hypothetical protein
MPCQVPVLFLIFNRFDTTKKVFEAIRQAKPYHLYVASDGPRDNRTGENEKVENIRRYVLDNIDWQCEVKTLFREKNLGCGKAVSGAITWFFEQEEMGIILEDDCLPMQSFFPFCETLLEYYKSDTRIFLISAYNKQGQWNSDKYDYFFSNLGGIWGWASWARAWKHYDFNISDIDEFISLNGFTYLFGKIVGKIRGNMMVEGIKKKKIDTWDYQFGYTRNKNNGLSIVPSKNLITNIGFNNEATHTTSKNVIFPKAYEIDIPININNYFIPDRYYDIKYYNMNMVIKEYAFMFLKNIKIYNILRYFFRKVKGY